MLYIYLDLFIERVLILFLAVSHTHTRNVKTTIRLKIWYRQKLFASEKILDIAEQLGMGPDIALNPAWNLRGRALHIISVAF